MTTGQSIFIIVLTVANIAGCLWLLWWTRRSPGEGATTDHTTGHVWDEDLRELNNPLPRWWLWLFIITVVFSVAYLVLYPGLGTFKGTLNWTSRAEHEGAVAPQRGAHRAYAGAVQRAQRRPNSLPTRRRSTSAATCFSTTAPPATAPMAAARPASPTSLTRTGCGAAMPTPWSPPSPMAAPA